MDTKFWKPPKKIEVLYETVLANNRFAAINRPTAGARNEKDLPVGKNEIQLYSVSTPNGQKVGILLKDRESVSPEVKKFWPHFLISCTSYSLTLKESLSLGVIFSY